MIFALFSKENSLASKSLEELFPISHKIKGLGALLDMYYHLSRVFQIGPQRACKKTLTMHKVPHQVSMPGMV